MKALDLFCGAGGATRGLQMAGFEVTGVDINPQPHYIGEDFYQADALTFPLEGYDLIWASPPCQFGSVLTAEKNRHKHPNHIPTVRVRLAGQDTPYIIENVGGSRSHLINPVMLCGTMFGLGVWRHRFFECSFPTMFPPSCCHLNSPRWAGQQGYESRTGYVPAGELRQIKFESMGIDWVKTDMEIGLAIPPAYSQWLAEQFISSENTHSRY